MKVLRRVIYNAADVFREVRDDMLDFFFGDLKATFSWIILIAYVLISILGGIYIHTRWGDFGLIMYVFIWLFVNGFIFLFTYGGDDFL